MALGAAAALSATLSPTPLLLAGGLSALLGIGAFVVARFAGRHGLGSAGRRAARPRGGRGAALAATNRCLAQARRRPGRPGLAGRHGCLIILPLVIYVASYKPWVDIGGQWYEGYPAGHTGQTFLQLQLSMYDYHNNLRATHAGGVAVVGLAARPQAGLVLPGGLRRPDTAVHLRHAATWSSSGWASRRCAFLCLAGVEAAAACR